jgi:hypothetical protein
MPAPAPTVVQMNTIDAKEIGVVNMGLSGDRFEQRPSPPRVAHTNVVRYRAMTCLVGRMVIVVDVVYHEHRCQVCICGRKHALREDSRFPQRLKWDLGPLSLGGTSVHVGHDGSRYS